MNYSKIESLVIKNSTALEAMDLSPYDGQFIAFDGKTILTASSFEKVSKLAHGTFDQHSGFVMTQVGVTFEISPAIYELIKWE